MKDIAINNLNRMSDDAIIKSIGNFIRYYRLEQNKTQDELAKEAGLNRTTLSDVELGRRCKVITLIQILRTLNLLHVLKDFEVKSQISPIQLAEIEMKKRRRASKTKKSNNKFKSDW